MIDPHAANPPTDSPPRVLALARLVIRSHPWHTLASVGAGAGGGLATIALIDTVNSAIHAGESARAGLPWFVALCLAVVVLRLVAQALPARAVQQIILAVRVGLCRQVLATPLRRIETLGVSHVVTLLAKDVPALAEALQLIPTVLVSFMVLAFGIGYVGYHSWAALSVVASCVGLGLLAYALLYRLGAESFRRNREEHTTLNGHLHAAVFGIKELKLHRGKRRRFQRAALQLSARRSGAHDLAGRLYFIAGENLGHLLFFVMIAAVAFAGSALLGLEAAALSACVFALIYCIEPLFTLVAMCPPIVEGAIALERLRGFQLPPTGSLDAVPKISRPVRFRERIALHGVQVDYGGEDTGFRLGPVDLIVHPGEMVFLIGGNGSGKTTLLKTLAGLYRPAAGVIEVDGAPVDDANIEAYRNLFSVVFSDFHVFEHVGGSGVDEPASERTRHFLARLRLDAKVSVCEGRLSTTTALSQGERKRLALLCAYLEDRPVLVLDEWAADQDPVFREFFYRVLLPELKQRGKCVVAITHDDKYFDAADRVIKLDAGRIASDRDAEAPHQAHGAPARPASSHDDSSPPLRAAVQPSP